MTKADVAKAFRSMKASVSKRSPEILMGLGITGMISAGVLAVKATPRALQLIDEKKREERKDELTKIEIVQTAWKCYAPAVLTAVFSTACLVGSNSVNARRNAALAAAYKLSETAIAEYSEKVTELVGEKKELAIREKVEAEKIEKQPASTSEVHVTGRGKTLVFDGWSGRYFDSCVEDIKRAQNDLNARMLNDMFGYVSLNDLYDELRLDRIEVGDLIGWNVHNRINIHIGAVVADDGRPCLTIIHNNRPEYEYDRL